MPTYYTTPDAVKDILGNNYDDVNCPPLMPYVKIAQNILLRAITCATEKGEAYTTSELTEMARWLGAYAYTIYDPIYKMKQTANSSAQYFDRSYLDPVKMMDAIGCVTAVLAGNRASLDWLGKEESDQLEYDERN